MHFLEHIQWMCCWSTLFFILPSPCYSLHFHLNEKQSLKSPVKWNWLIVPKTDGASIFTPYLCLLLASFEWKTVSQVTSLMKLINYTKDRWRLYIYSVSLLNTISYTIQVHNLRYREGVSLFTPSLYFFLVWMKINPQFYCIFLNTSNESVVGQLYFSFFPLLVTRFVWMKNRLSSRQSGPSSRPAHTAVSIQSAISLYIYIYIYIYI